MRICAMQITATVWILVRLCAGCLYIDPRNWTQWSTISDPCL